MGRPSPLSGILPHESVIYREFERGARAAELSTMFNVPVKAMKAYLDHRRQRWLEQPPRALSGDARKIVIERECFDAHAYRRIRISLPRNSMHLAVLEDRP